MNIGILGTGMVGQTIGTKLVALGHNVMLGSRSAMNEKAKAWQAALGERALTGTFADAAKFGEIVFNCTNGMASLDALRSAGVDNVRGKILIDVSNPLDFTKGFPPSLSVSNTDSLAEQIQREFPETQVVKTLNTVNCQLMVDPSLVPGEHDIFVSGNDPEARSAVASLMREWFGWQTVIDLGDITTARGAEQILPIWVRLMGQLKTPFFNFHIAKQP